MSNLNLQLLGITAIPRLADKFEVQVKLPKERMLFGMPGKEFLQVCEEATKILNLFFKEHKVSWWDVYCNSDIGMERMALAKQMQFDKHDMVLDVGCGRGYFSIAAAKSCKFLVGVDLMNGGGRRGWWKNFRTSLCKMNLFEGVACVRSDARRVSFRSSSFNVATTVHAIRNFRDKPCIETVLMEMKRVVVKGGSVILVESLPVARTKPQEAHLEMFRCKVKCTSGDMSYLPKEELLEMFQRAGFKKIEVKELNYNWSAAPPLFSIDPYLSSLKENERGEAREAYDRAIRMVRKWGQVSPPAVFVKATR